MRNDLILKEVLKKIEPSKEDRDLIENSVKSFMMLLKKNLSKVKNKPEVFFGGSYAKKTMIKKDKYDIDIFLRFDKDEKEISKKTKNFLKGIKNVSIVHGSRDYYRIKINDSLFIELVPVVKISKPKEAKNITDLSYSHVKYINKKIKNKKILDDIKIAKAFCYANKCYGAESYIRGFSGYSLELLVYYYRGFANMLRNLVKSKEGKLIIDIEKDYKNKKDVLIDMNSAKLMSPVVLVDPTYPERNALAALSPESFMRFKQAGLKFLKNPSLKSFEEEKINPEEIKKDALRKKQEFILLEFSTSKQEGDIAGSKLLKFYNHIVSEIERFYEIKKKGFNYNNKKSSRAFFAVLPKKEIVYSGPFKNDEKNVQKFKKEHKNIFFVKERLYAKENFNVNIKDFLRKWADKNKERIKEMSVVELDVLQDF